MALEQPTIDDMLLLWETIDCAEDARGGDWSEVRDAHARVLNYLRGTGVIVLTPTAQAV